MTQVRRRTVVYLRHQLGALSLIVACALLALTACGSFPVFGKKESQRTKLIEKMSKLVGKPFAHSRAKLEVHDIRYDGEYLQSRLLISPGDGPLLLDKRVSSAVDVAVGAVRDCSTGERLKHIVDGARVH